MANLPTETMEEILVKLPVKDLLRFKCVCKDWLSLITSHRFIDRHYSYKSKQAGQLLRLYPITGEIEQYFYCFHRMYDDNRRFLRFEEVNFHQQLPFCNDLISDIMGPLMGPVNGIFCLRFNSGDLAMSNPAIRELRPLPRGTFEYQFGNPFFYALGFGCDISCGNLKVVAVSQDFLGRPSETACVYNFSTDSWKTIEIQMAYFRIRNQDHHAFVNGVYYWFVDYDKTNFGILAFDMRSENFHQIMIPDYVGVSLSPPLKHRIVEHRNSRNLVIVGMDSLEILIIPMDSLEIDVLVKCGCWMAVLWLCTPLGPHKFVGELWVMKREGYWRRIRKAKADWILPKEWLKTDKDGVIELVVGSDHAYKESLFSIKREGEGEDSIRAFLHPSCWRT